jgi:hypothetical protein
MLLLDLPRNFEIWKKKPLCLEKIFFLFVTLKNKVNVTSVNKKIDIIKDKIISLFSTKFRILKQYKYPKIRDPVSPKKNLLGPLL